MLLQNICICPNIILILSYFASLLANFLSIMKDHIFICSNTAHIFFYFSFDCIKMVHTVANQIEVCADAPHVFIDLILSVDDGFLIVTDLCHETSHFAYDHSDFFSKSLHNSFNTLEFVVKRTYIVCIGHNSVLEGCDSAVEGFDVVYVVHDAAFEGRNPVIKSNDVLHVGRDVAFVSLEFVLKGTNLSLSFSQLHG